MKTTDMSAWLQKEVENLVPFVKTNLIIVSGTRRDGTKFGGTVWEASPTVLVLNTEDSEEYVAVFDIDPRSFKHNFVNERVFVS